MPRVAFDTSTTLSPQQVTALLTDFSERRPQIWPGLWDGAYKAISVGDTTAEVREGNKSPKVWARERYDWSKPGVVRWEVLESNFCKPGSFVEAQISPGSPSGSRVHVVWNRTPSSFMGQIATAMIVITRGAPVKASLNKGFKKAEAGGGS
jgi:hypothetical protein